MNDGVHFEWFRLEEQLGVAIVVDGRGKAIRLSREQAKALIERIYEVREEMAQPVVKP